MSSRKRMTDMAGQGPLRVLLVAEGSGGHLIPALQAAHALARRGVHAHVWYARRQQTARLADAVARQAADDAVRLDPIALEPSRHVWRRVWRCAQLWRKAQRCFETFSPDVVVGFGGWVSAPVLLAARLRGCGGPFGRRRGTAGGQRRVSCLLHEQNVVMGRANRWLARWVDRVAVSFQETQATLRGVSSVMTGLPVRDVIGRSSRLQGASRFGFSPGRPTVLVLGGSQGARAVNRLAVEAVKQLSAPERRKWQILHLTGAADEPWVRAAYAASRVKAWTAPFLDEMELAYAQADVVIARAGASTIAELACCGKPCVLIPYPYAGGHQWANAQVVEATGGGLLIEELPGSSGRVLAAVRRILADRRLREMMGEQMTALYVADAAERLACAIIESAPRAAFAPHPPAQTVLRSTRHRAPARFATLREAAGGPDDAASLGWVARTPPVPARRSAWIASASGGMSQSMVGRVMVPPPTLCPLGPSGPHAFLLSQVSKNGGIGGGAPQVLA